MIVARFAAACSPRDVRQRRSVRNGFTLVELVLAMASAGILLVGLASALLMSAKAFRPETNQQYLRSSAAVVQRDLLADLRLATGFTERTATAATFTVPDRDGDNRPETLRYAWSGVAGDPLTLALNGGTPFTVLANVRGFALDYRMQVVNGVPLPAEQTGGTVLLIVSNSSSLTSQEATRKSFLESWNFQVSVKGLNDPPADLLAAAGGVQVVYISGSVTAAALSTAASLAALPVGIVCENRDLVDEFGFGASASASTLWSLTIAEAAHYVNQDVLGNSTCTPVILSTSLSKIDGTPAAALNKLQTTSNLPAIATLDPDEAKYGGGVAAGRRVFVPWGHGSFEPLVLSEVGKQLMFRTVEWASGMGDESPDQKSFGYATVFPTAKSGVAGKQMAVKTSLSEPGKLLTITAYVGGASNKNVRFALYADASGEPGVLLVESANGKTGSSMAWLTLDVPDTNLPAGTYWLAFSFADAAQKYQYIDSYSGAGERNNNNNATTNGFLDSWGASSNTYNGARSIYATYEVTP